MSTYVRTDTDGMIWGRGAARERPAEVARVITLGSPVIGGPKYTAVADVYRRQGYDLDAIEAGRSRLASACRSRFPSPRSIEDGWRCGVGRLH
jgi:hypothetical protein